MRRSIFAILLCFVLGFFVPALDAAEPRAGLVSRACQWFMAKAGAWLRGDQRDLKPPSTINFEPVTPAEVKPGQIARLEMSMGGLALRDTPGLRAEDSRALAHIATETDFQSFLDGDREYFRNLKAKDVNAAIADSDIEALSRIFGNLDVTLGALGPRDYFEVTVLGINWKSLEKLIDNDMFLLRNGFMGAWRMQVLLGLLEELETIFDQACEADTRSEYEPISGDSLMTRGKKVVLKKFHEQTAERNRVLYNKFLLLSREVRTAKEKARGGFQLPPREDQPQRRLPPTQR